MVMEIVLCIIIENKLLMMISSILNILRKHTQCFFYIKLVLYKAYCETYIFLLEIGDFQVCLN